MEFTHFRVTNYRNIIDSGEIEVGKVTSFVGQNEAGKSNLFDALCRINPFDESDSYNIDEDWPVDDWGGKNATSPVCEAVFVLAAAERAELYAFAGIPQPAPTASDPTEAAAQESEASLPPPPPPIAPKVPNAIKIVAKRTYTGPTTFEIGGIQARDLDLTKAAEWIRAKLPKFVYVHDYELSGAQIELPALAERVQQVQWHQLTNEEQTIKIILDLANIKLDDFIAKGATPEGRTVRAFDKRQASAYLSKQFRDLWRQKKVEFDIDVDGPTLNIFARDDAVDMPVRLMRRSSGFRWHVSFAWKFTHASRGHYKNCILLLEEPGIHLHYSGQRDLLEVFDRLSADNVILFTTHLASMVDLGNPERVRIVESKDNHSVVKKGVVSSQRAPAAVIEIALGLTGELSGLLGSRQTLIVEGGDDALVLRKLSSLLAIAKKTHLSERIYLWPAHGAPNTPMYAAVAAGNGWDAGVLLDTDPEGELARNKIRDMVLKELAEESRAKFRVLMLGESAGIGKVNAAIEDLFDDEFYIDCVNATFGLAMKEVDLPVDGSDMITKRIERFLVKNHGHKKLDRRRVMREVLRRFDTWKKIGDLPVGTADRAEKLFNRINTVFAVSDVPEVA
ncbi:MAG: hypothetical protein EPO10_16935 [Reyranella sp.]|uniref:ATP-dependent nuclease n=1 Tax=Reyranella sp. TaxID=1929291 RepID=UPI00121E597A|nr:AAA family ATPase [Reyranella sp.]TAJ98103.1 MAG: hypothetical protein EPO41_01200 [Reyranella sp.]TBR27671.1 MAG: hypothetical protein EPO10_16935 [Reyranella sp.]